MDNRAIHKFEIVKHIGKLSYINNGYTKELNFISWNNREPVYDIRTWNQEHTKYGKGVTLTLREMVLDLESRTHEVRKRCYSNIT